MDNPILHQFKELCALEPDRALAAGLKASILTTPQKRPRFFSVSLPFLAACSGAAFVVVLIVTGGAFLHERSAYARLSLDNESDRMTDEFATINIELKEIEYRTTVHRTIASALQEITTDSVPHLHSGILEDEQATIEIFSSPLGGEVDALLERVIF